MAKERLDQLLVKKGLVASRERARSAIMAGKVFVAGQKIDKAGTLIAPEAAIELKGHDIPFVSRGGLKLAKAVQFFSLSLAGKTMIDIGASTGGFTDCALQQGARKVFAIDVGYGQLAWSLRTDERVVNMERTNIRHVTPDQIGESIDFISIDVAFISLDKVLPVAKELLSEGGELVALIKPQFEAGREKVGKKGVVRDPLVHIEVIAKIINLADHLEFIIAGLTFSPIKGPEGNIEYLLYLKKQTDKLVDEMVFDQSRIEGLVAEAHGNLTERTEEAPC
ncbi:MAG: TlyA family RNA methyltransferase [Sporomusaceae bacterium]|nr:TlyA family RNA methyltransferase [Sporomusaceae bacterium]